MVVDLECCFNCKHLAELVVVVTWRRGVIEQSSRGSLLVGGEGGFEG